MNGSLTKFIIGVLLLVVLAFGYKLYVSGGFDNVKSAPVTAEEDVESH
jgi:hypothetical protein